MKHTARIQTAIEILDTYDPGLGPLESSLKYAFKHRRYVGSKDRHYIKDFVYDVIRFAPKYLELQDNHKAKQLSWQQDCGRMLVLMHLVATGACIHKVFCDDPYGPASLSSKEQDEIMQIRDHLEMLGPQDHLPTWLRELLSPICDALDLEALNTPAPVDLRIHTAKISRSKVIEQLAAEGIRAFKTPYSPLGLRLDVTGPKMPLTNHPLFRKGFIDIQDEGSQIIALLMDPQPNEAILDLCAGGGGKTLAMAEQLGQDDRLYATDYDPERLAKTTDRLLKRGFSCMQHLSYDRIQSTQFNNFFDKVLIDAPCSGLGTLRRNPALKLSLTPEKIRTYSKIQSQLLERAMALVKPGGIILYATCSLAPTENTHVIEKALTEHANISLLDVAAICAKLLTKVPLMPRSNPCKGSLLLTPGKHQTDGFFIALLKKMA